MFGTFLYDTINGGGHLWFIPVILLCYFLTPFYSKLFDSVESRSSGTPLLPGMGLLLLNVLLYYRFFPYFHPAWMNCYLLGFLLRRIYQIKKSDVVRIAICLIIVICVGLNVIQILVDYILQLDLSETNQWYYSRLCEHAHTFLGISLFIVLKGIFRILLSKKVPQSVRKTLQFSDKYSYNIYLVHQFLILGPFTLMGLTTSYGVNICIIVVLAVGLGVAAKSVSQIVKATPRKFLFLIARRDFDRK